MSVEGVTLGEVLEGVAPAERVLHLAVVGDTAFVEICSYEEDNKSRTMTIEASISVDAHSLGHQIALLVDDYKRFVLRDDVPGGKSTSYNMRKALLLAQGSEKEETPPGESAGYR